VDNRNVPGVYDEWEDCLEQVNKFSGNNYEGFKTKEEVKAGYFKYMPKGERKKNGVKNFAFPILLNVNDRSLDNKTTTSLR
jgi:viroplasmin and RNaseH domain-containing protein